MISSIRIHFYSSNVNLRTWRVLRCSWTLLSHTWTDFASICFLLLSAYIFLLSAQRAPSPHQNPPKPSREKEKVLQSCHDKRADLKTDQLSIKLALWIFSDTFYPCNAWRRRIFLIHSILPLAPNTNTGRLGNSGAVVGLMIRFGYLAATYWIGQCSSFYSTFLLYSKKKRR